MAQTESPTCPPASPAAPAGTLRYPQADLDPLSLRSVLALSSWSCHSSHANVPLFSFSSGYFSFMLNPPLSSAAHELNITLPLLLLEVCFIIQRTKVSASEDECRFIPSMVLTRHLLRRGLSIAIRFLFITRGRKTRVKVSVKLIEATHLVYVSTAELTGFLLVTVFPLHRT